MRDRRILCRLLSAVALAMPLLISVFMPDPVAAQDTQSDEQGSTPRERELRDQLKNILQELEDLQKAKESVKPEAERPAIIKEKAEEKAETAPPGAIPEYELADTSIISTRFVKRPEGITLQSTDRSGTDSRPTVSMKESLDSLPGVVLRQANGPRDFSVNIRGSGVKTNFAIRDVKVYEDGIQQTQSDGLSRLDLQDPWFYQSVEVTSGASSSLYDNYAIGGMVHFRTRRGSDINGVESFLTGGSYGYQKYGFAFGKQYSNLDIAMFGSQVAADGYIQHSDYNTQSVDFNTRFRVDDKQTIYFKFIANWLQTNVPNRLTISQFNADPRSQGTTTGSSNVPTAFLGQERKDRRDIAGALYERQINANTLFSLEADYDVKDIHQPFANITDQVQPNFKGYADLRHDGTMLSMPLKSYVGIFFNNMETTTSVFTNLGNFNATYGPLKQYYTGTIRNLGARFREELEFVPKWTLAAGMGFEQSILSVSATNYTNGVPSSYVNVNNTYYNYAPELSLTWKPADGYRHWARASTGYGIPTFSNLLTGLNGQPGANASVKPEQNLNLELGTDDKVTSTLSLHMVGFFEYFHNEIITQTPAANLSSYAINANWSEFYGVEAGYTWRPTEEWRLTGAYTHLYSSYISFTDQYIQNGVVTQVNQAGHQVPNVPSDILNLKEAYDHSTNGWGGWVETSYYNSYFLNNGNSVGIPSYWLWNLNVHKELTFTNNSWFRFAKFYLELDNVANKHYAASGAVISDGTPDAQKQLFYAGYGRAIYGGVTLGLF